MRVVKTPEGQILLDESGRMNGRGAYICRDPECMRKAIKTKGLDRSFREKVPEDVCRQLEKEMSTIAERC